MAPKARFFVQCDVPFTWEGIVPSGGGTLFADDGATSKTMIVNQLEVLTIDGVVPFISLEGPGGFLTNGFVTILGGNSIPAPPYAVGGFIAYMLGVRSDLGLTDPTVVIQCTGVQPHFVLTDGVNTRLLVARGDGAAGTILDASGAVSLQMKTAAGDPIFLDSDSLQIRNANGSSPYTAGDWAGAAPTTLKQAINRMSALLKTLNGGVPIP